VDHVDEGCRSVAMGQGVWAEPEVVEHPPGPGQFGLTDPPRPPPLPDPSAGDGERHGQSVQPIAPCRAVQRTAEQVEHRVQRAADEEQIPVAAAGNDLAGTCYEVVDEPQLWPVDSIKERAELVRCDQIPPERKTRLDKRGHKPECGRQPWLWRHVFPADWPVATGFNHAVGMAKIRRIADRAHRGQLFAGGGLFVDHLGRVAGVVDELGGGTIAVAAAWLYAVPATGTGLHDLLRQGIPARVVNAVDVLQQRPAEYPPQFTDRLLRHWQAALIRYAVLGDWHRHLAGAGRYEHWRSQHDRLADALGLPLPARKPGLPPGEVDRLIGQRPAGEEHWGPIARTLERLRDPRALPTLVEAYHEVNGDDARHADPRTTMRYDRARKNLDRHPNYILTAYMASGT
jgi:hypothetical protein